MAFGQQSGPPASQRQLASLKTLLQAAGHDDFRTARHEYGLTQRQAGGKFTVAEASELIDRLEGSETAEPPPVMGRAVVAPERTSTRADAVQHTQTTLLRGMPADLLATELERRNWVVIPPA